jgi:hypothetical protein
MNMFRDKKRRFGMIAISDHFFYDQEDFLFEVYQKLRFLPFDSTAMPCERYIQVKGTSPYFEEILPGQMIPEYRIIAETDEDGSVKSVHVTKEEEVRMFEYETCAN